jgi:hypothetical protein
MSLHLKLLSDFPLQHPSPAQRPTELLVHAVRVAECADGKGLEKPGFPRWLGYPRR